MRTPLARQLDGLTELVHQASAQAASMLARLVGDVGVLVDVPCVLETPRTQLGWLLGGRDLRVFAVTFALVGDVPGALWWVLPMEAADTLGRRLLRRPSATGTLSASASAALGEAANIVASAFCSTAGSLVRAKMLPSTPLAVETNVEALVAAPEIEAEIIGVSAFLSTNAPHFRGTLVSRFSPESVARLLSALGNQ